MSAFDNHKDELEKYEFMMGPARGRLAVSLDLLTDALTTVGQHTVYCRSDRFPDRTRMDIELVISRIEETKELIQSVMKELSGLSSQR